MRTSVITMIFLAASLSMLSADSTEEALYREVLSKTFTSAKMPVVRKLAELRTRAAEECLKRLMNDDDMWNSESGVNGLLLLNRESSARILFDGLMRGGITAGRIEEGMKKDPVFYRTMAAERYRTLLADDSSDDGVRSVLLSIIATSGDEQFIRNIAALRTARDRDSAFNIYIRHFSKTGDAFIRGQLADPGLRISVLNYIAHTGTKNDLPLFRDIAAKKGAPAEERMIAHSAIHAWADDAEKEKSYLAALEGDDAAVRAGCMEVYRDTRSPRIMLSLCRTAKTAPGSDERVTAASRLTAYDDRSVIPYLIPALAEQYIPSDRSGLDIFIGAITLGMTSVLDHLSRSRKREAFAAAQDGIAAHLRSLTGADCGVSYMRWKEWAVLNGYTIQGENIIQYLFSGYARRRTAARQNAARLLGYQDLAAFLAANADLSGEREQSLALAELLLKKGVLADQEEYGEAERE